MTRKILTNARAVRGRAVVSTALLMLALISCMIWAGNSEAAKRPRTLVKRHAAKVYFGPNHRIRTVVARCPGNSTFVSGYVTFGNDKSPFGAEVLTEDMTIDDQGWEATVRSLGLYSAGEEVSTAEFTVNAICIR